jgi:ABC-type phosphate transport system substrate-binding protein
MAQWSRRALALVAAGIALGVSAEAEAADCNFTTAQNPVYVTGSSASQPVLAAISAVLAAQATPITLVYVKSESCAGVATFTSGGAVPATATYWPGGTATTCTFGNTQPAPKADASASDVFSSTCPNITLTSSQKEFSGPVQAMTFIVHPNSTESSMSQEAAHVVMKDIATASLHITPWADPTNIFIRPGGATGSGTRAMIGTALGLADGDWDASLTVKAGSGDVLAAVAGDQAAANASLGILSVSVADNNRVGCSGTCTPVKVLAFQNKGQGCGYLPDSTANSFDKLNVREGRYWIWGPIHFITAVDGSGNPVSTANPGVTDAAVATFIKALTLPPGDTTFNDTQKEAILAAAAKGHVVPQCAMRVKRAQEVGGEQSFVPDEPCGCYWEAQATGATPAACHTCTTDNDCSGQSGTPKCRYGFCEVQ